MNNIEKYKILSEGMPFAHRAKIAMVMLDSATVYEELKEDAEETWSDILHRYFLELEWMPKKEDYNSTRSYNKAWEYFGELLAVVKQNNHPEFEKYLEIAKENGMNEVVLERKLNELSEIKKSFELASK